MTDFEDYEDDDQQDGTALLRDLRKQLKDLSKKNKDMEAQLAEQTTKTRGMTLKEILKGAGVPEKVASLVPGNVEPTADAVGEWLKEYGDIFGATQGGSSSTEGQGDQEVPDEVLKMKQMQDVASAGEIKGQSRQVGLGDIAAATSEQELWALIKKGASGS
jgi:predicted ribosome quality control (RQC) complex YloA/Tae2 family protein